MRASVLSHENRKRSSIALAAACVFLAAAAGYLLSFSGAPISDDEELYASAARNLAVNGTLSAEQLTGNARLAGSYHGVEPAFPVLASAWYRLFLHSGSGHLQTLYLLPVLCTALSAALIVVIAGQLGYAASVSTVAGLLYAFGSMAWPYAKTLFREPLLGLLLLGSLSAFLWIVREGRRSGASLAVLAILLMLLAALTLTRVAMGAAAAVLLIALPLVHPATRGNQRRLAGAAALGLVLLAALAAGLGRVDATDADILYRFTGGFAQDAITRLNTMPHTHLAEALAAPLVSPWKGLLWYSPVCCAGLIAIAMYGRRQAVVSVLAVTVLASLLLVQALAYDGEWWTPTWGSRFLLPAIPVLTVASLPLLERLAQGDRSGKLAIGGIFVAGVVIQLPAVLFNSAEFTATTYREVQGTFPGALIWDVTRTPIVAQWQGWTSQAPDLLLWRAAGAEPTTAVAVGILAAGALLAAVWLLRRVVAGGKAAAFVMLPVLLLAGGTAMLLRLSIYDLAYEMTAFGPLCGYIGSHVQATDVLIVQPYPGPAWEYLMNSECGQRTWYSLPYEGAGEAAAELIAKKIPQGAHYWVIQQFWSGAFSPEADSLATQGDRLLQEATFQSPYHLFVGEYERGQAK